MERRTFVKAAAAAGVAWMVDLRHARAYPRSAATYFHLHPFIEAHPEAVFVKRTNVTDKTDASAKIREGRAFAGEVFTLDDTAGIPLSTLIALKPNLTCSSGTGGTAEGMGIRTDTAFLEGVITGMTNAGFEADRIYMREGNWLGDGYCSQEYLVGDVQDIASRTGVHLLDLPSGLLLPNATWDTLGEDDVVWKDVPNGEIFNRIGYVHPYNRPDAWTLNIAKFKAHSMGLTLCAKNLQGTVISPLVRFCEGLDATALHSEPVRANFRADRAQRIQDAYDRHLAAGYARWDRPGRDASGGFGMETWLQRTLDSHSVMGDGFHVIEGIYGRNGSGFVDGPGPDGKAQDFLSNMLVFGRNAFLVDAIGLWLGGHEPGNFGLLRAAMERGLTRMINPRTIPLYRWEAGGPVRIALTDLSRTPLVSPYLRRDYNGQQEDSYHLVDEPFDYSTLQADAPSAPASAVIGRNYPNPFAAQTVIEYRLPRPCTVSLDVFDSNGLRIASLAGGRQTAGIHVASWDCGRVPAGVYFYRFQADGITETRSMTVLR